MDNKYTILLVDDEVNILRVLQRLFADEDYEILTAQSGEEGLRILEHAAVDLIISDQKMPGMSGLEFLEKTVTPYPDVIRIILTGHADLEMALEAINKGFVYKFILKPWNNYDLKITVRRALEQYNLLKDNRDLTNELRKRDAILQQLEKQYPGITKKPKNGIYRIS